MENVKERATRIIVDTLGVDKSEVKLDSSFKEDFGADSLDQIELVMNFENEFNINISEDEIEGITTVRDAIRFIENHINNNAEFKQQSKQNQESQKSEEESGLSTRNFLQDVYNKDHLRPGLFWYEKDEITLLGIQIGETVYYASIGDQNKCFVAIGINFMKEGIKAIYDMSQPRFDYLQRHCPTLCESILDGSNERFDRGAIVELHDHYMLATILNYNIYKDFKRNPDIFFEEDSVITEAAIELIKRLTSLCEELDKWEGFTAFEEAKIAVKEALPGIQWGLRIGRLFG